MYLRIDATGSFNFQSESKSQKYFNFYYDIPINLYSTFKNTWDFFDIISMSTYSTFVEYYPKILVLGIFSATNIYIFIFFHYSPRPFFQLTVSETKSTGAINKKNTSKKLGKKKKNESKDEEDDIDKLLAAFDKVDNVCNGEGCKAKIATLGVTCEHCRRR